ncbi:MAG: hypothetical protein HeimC2_10170 [Candidatus Heimdallarchaeota archaeon LC_2]|nr:MAG: hypothetical protein HeimC2_10170 [Candidatus Heimdallarchaeota archaeon LC_2]
MESGPDLLEKSEEPIKFALVGISGIFVNLLVLFLAYDVFEIFYGLSLAIGFMFSVTSNYILNRIWTFNSKGSILPEYLKYVASNYTGFLIQLSVVFTAKKLSPKQYLVIPFIDLNIDIIYFASLFGIFLGFVSNFLFSKFFVFNNSDNV